MGIAFILIYIKKIHNSDSSKSNLHALKSLSQKKDIAILKQTKAIWI